MKKVVLIVIIVAILGALGFFVVGRFFTEPETVIAPDGQTESVEQTEQTRPPKERKTLPAEFQNDKDRDGLTEDEEVAYGTSDTETDTDGDGLSDFDEVNRWGTDPTNVDTDGDGFADFMEILSGYNPAGDGPLVN